MDVAIIGGGSAGLQAALTLGRMRFDVVVVDAGAPSNAQATRVDADRTVTLADGSEIRPRAVVLATGADYAVPDVPGLAELWGTSVIHCPFCHGWEARDARIGVLVASEEHASHVPPMLQRLSADVQLFEALAGVRSRDGALTAVVLPDGTDVPRDVLFVAAPPRPRDAAFAHLDLDRNEAGALVVDTFGRTAIEGIYAAGDLIPGPQAVVQALASAQRAAVGVTRDLGAP
jgi:thioredoxin reductase